MVGESRRGRSSVATGNPTGRLHDCYEPGTMYMPPDSTRMTIQGTDTDLMVTRVTNDAWGNRYEFDAIVYDFHTLSMVRDILRTGEPLRVAISNDMDGLSTYEGQLLSYTVNAERDRPTTISFTLYIPQELRTVPYRSDMLIGGRQHKCYECDRHLIFHELRTANNRMTEEQLRELWDNEDVEFLCCQCHGAKERLESLPPRPPRITPEEIQRHVRDLTQRMSYTIGTASDTCEWADYIMDGTAVTPGMVVHDDTTDSAIINDIPCGAASIAYVDRCDNDCVDTSYQVNHVASTIDDILWQGTYAFNTCKICGGTHAFYNDNTCQSCRDSSWLSRLFKRIKKRFKK